MSSWFHFPVSFRPYSLANFLICGVRAMLDCKQVVRLLRQRRNCLLERALGRAEPFLAYRSSDMPTRPNHRPAPRSSPVTRSLPVKTSASPFASPGLAEIHDPAGHCQAVSGRAHWRCRRLPRVPPGPPDTTVALPL